MKHTFYLITLSALTALFCAGPARAQYNCNLSDPTKTIIFAELP